MSTLLKFLAGLFFLIIFGAIATYIFVKMSAKPLDDAARAQAPGRFITLTAGQIHYRWHGPEDGPVIVMSHGFSTPNFIFEQNAKALVNQGFRVLTYDHFGRGWSDRPKADYTPDFYDTELLELADGLGLSAPFGLVGLSMGGPITAEFTARHPERVSKLFLFVPAGLVLGTKEGSTTDKLMRTPVLGNWVWRIFGKRILLGDSQYDESATPADNRLAGDVSEQMQYAGYFEALLSSYRHLPMHDQDDIYRRVSQTGVPVAAMFGVKDETVLIESAARLSAAIPAAKVMSLSEGEHGLNYQMQAETNPALIEFFAAEPVN